MFLTVRTAVPTGLIINSYLLRSTVTHFASEHAPLSFIMGCVYTANVKQHFR